ncbi:MAG: anti-sigma factor [Actinomycetota bacterium]|nr:anti-sigma factor [Actinomycetota bacterium]
MTQRSHEDLKGLVAAYVLGAVPPDEVRVVRAHILTCDECMAEADDYAGAMDSLALAVEPAALPPGFADRVMSQLSPAEERSTAPATTGWRATLRSRLAPLAAGAAAVIALAVVGAGYMDARTDLARSEHVLAQIVQSEEILELRGQGGTLGRFAPTSDGAVLAVSGLPEAPGSHVYQLWYMNDGRPTGAATFDATDGVVTMELDRSFNGFDAVAVTIEPPGGSRQPTGDPVIASF